MPLATHYWPDGVRPSYEGEVDAAGVRHGHGREYTADGLRTLVYEGEFRDGVAHGAGRRYVAYRSGALVYEGRFVAGEMQGEGRVYFTAAERGREQEGDVDVHYVGGFDRGARDGWGVSFYRDTRQPWYVGQWQGGERYGRGVQYFVHGGIEYDGEFARDRFDGVGTRFYPGRDATVAYVGAFADGRREGSGHEFARDGSLAYSGEFARDCRHGFGREYDRERRVVAAGVYVEGARI